jgi:hypothetical protein
MSIEISLGALPFIYLIIVFLTPIKLDMNLLIVLCVFTLSLTFIQAIASIVSKR